MKIRLFVQLCVQGFVSTEFPGCFSDGTGCGLLTFGDNNNMRELRMDLDDMGVGVDIQDLACIHFPNTPSIWLLPPSTLLFCVDVNICLPSDPFLYTGSCGSNQTFSKLLPYLPSSSWSDFSNLQNDHLSSLLRILQCLPIVLQINPKLNCKAQQDCS